MRTLYNCNGSGIAQYMVGISSYPEEIKEIMIMFRNSECLVDSVMASREKQKLFSALSTEARIV